MTRNVTAGNTVCAADEEEVRERRRCQTAAVVNSERLMRELPYCGDVMPVKASAFAPCIEQTDFEIRLLKGRRKAGNKIEELTARRRHTKEEEEQNSLSGHFL